MSTFHYRALATDGKVRSGTLSSGDEAAAVRELRRQGMTPVFVGTSRPGGLSLKLPSFPRRRSRDILHFTEEVATLLAAGIPRIRPRPLGLRLPAFRSTALCRSPRN